MVVGIADVKHLDWFGRARVTGAVLGAMLLVVSGIAAGVLANMAFVSATTWPYHVVARRMVGTAGTSPSGLPQVRPGGPLSMQRLIDYHEIDCERWYARRAVSEVKDGPQAGRVHRFELIHDPKLPSDLSGRWQTWSDVLPADFPCGYAYLVETVTAACSAFHYAVRYLHKPDIITPFQVVGCGPPPG